MDFARLNKVVPRLFDANEGTAISALTAIRSMTEAEIASGTLHIKDIAFAPPTQPQTVLLTDLIKEHKRPLEKRIGTLESELRVKDRQIKELVENGCVVVSSTEKPVDVSQYIDRIAFLEKKIIDQEAEILRLTRLKMTVNDLATKPEPIKPTNVHAEYRAKPKPEVQITTVKTKMANGPTTSWKSFREPLMQLIRTKGGRVNATEAKSMILPILSEFGIKLTDADLVIGHYPKRPTEPLWYNTIQVTAKNLKIEGVLKTPSQDETAMNGWWELS